MTHLQRKKDHQLKAAIADELAWTPSVAADRIGVALADGAVTLSGQVQTYPEKGRVDWQYQREAAWRAVAALPGVSGVRNTITLKPSTAVSPAQAKAKITAALVRNAQLDAQRVHVAVTGSEVRLTGIVSSWAKRRQAEHAAWFAPGVTHVDNQLRVTS